MWDQCTPQNAEEIYEIAFNEYCEMFDAAEEQGIDSMNKPLLQAFGNSI